MLPLEHGFAMSDDPAFPLGADAVVLAHTATSYLRRRGMCVLDLGCGAGAVMLLLAAALPDLTAVGLELRPDAARLARENIRANGADGRLTAVEGDLRQIGTLFPAESFHAVVANPPYYRVGAGKPPSDASSAAARTELTATLADFCAAAAYLLPSAGEFFVLYRTERLADLLCALREVRLEPKTLVFRGVPPETLVCRAKKGANPGLEVRNV